jgi:hypothetical protein
MVVRTQVFGPHSRVVVDINDEKARRVFVRFADEDAKKRATKVLAAAKFEAPRGKTGALRAGIKMDRSRDTRGRYETGYDVISTAPHTMFVIKPTRPHIITGNPLLGFFWAKAGRFVVFHSVHHPGTKGNNFLSRALRAAR